ncbi:hypothetical protein HYU11_04700 [Candidatus Woesearchaeota archaeon]|nr:hypothetical protein [Candidatus Woesearchaeota archaeon]
MDKRIVVIIIGIIAIAALLAVKPPITGRSTMATSVMVTGAMYSHECSIQISNGWNLITIPCIQENSSIENFSKTAAGKYRSIHYYNSSSPDKWKAYNPELPEWVVQDLKSTGALQGYYVNATADSTIRVNGTIMTYQSVRLLKGWNLIAYPTNTTLNLATAFSTIQGKYAVVYMLNSSTKIYHAYYPDGSNNTISLTQPYKGYWINMTEETTWNVAEN